ncbi:MAG: DUF808 domain-containing protein [Gemmatimonadaceae bacterium]|nr:DUF808 domain-containing protein [Gemmatimonadaceae bacterium]
MAASLLTLLDDLATLFDDIAVMTRVAARKTAGVIGDDLALNAEQVTGMRADRELPVVWAVAKGAVVNKAILVAFLCYEGFEKTWHKLRPTPPDARAEQVAHVAALADETVDLVAMERAKVKGAVRTDFILSAEVIVIALGTMTTGTTLQRFLALSAVGLGMVVLVYGLVAGLVKLDDLGLRLHRTEGTDASAQSSRSLGAFILRAAPILMKGLSVLGTAAMFMVGGSILVHGVPPVEHAIAGVVRAIGDASLVGTIVKTLLDALVGIAAGGVLVLLGGGASRLMKRDVPAAATP